ncbi:uncharacterized protein LOC111245674 isoform X1 [Varroa destructor]|uniref:Ig-like domain-containing protein n=1 Tax=Varroa destructor TaxID=109461 RepID=A0A7M7JRG1_VARDE|nr:uncharacterized protein LOC111245674 isoform X1 [Varroa destructor]XP_022650060.1 uncharacterized protein LOC111245674 isoform X1 [Varroa destructor]
MTDYQLSMEDIHLLRQWFPRVIFLLSCLGCFEPGRAFGQRVIFTGVRILGKEADEQLSVTTITYAQPAHEELILDCLYHIQALDNTLSSSTVNNTIATRIISNDLVVKWFRNEEAAPFYTWISATGSRLFHHAYLDLIDSRYKYNDAPKEMFRAVRFPRAVKELSGNFTCEVLDAQGGDVATDENELSFDTSAKDHLELYIYDVPSVFELRLNLSQRTLHCLASTREEPSQLRLDLYQIDYDAVERPFARTDFNSSGISSGQTRKGNQGIVVIEGTVALQNEDVVVPRIGNSRTFFCDLIFTRIRRTVKPVIFRRTIRIVHEGTDTDYGEPYGMPEAAAWSGSDSSAATVRTAAGPTSPQYFHLLFDRRKKVLMAWDSGLFIQIISLYITLLTLAVNISTTFTM